MPRLTTSNTVMLLNDVKKDVLIHLMSNDDTSIQKKK